MGKKFSKQRHRQYYSNFVLRSDYFVQNEKAGREAGISIPRSENSQLKYFVHSVDLLSFADACNEN